MPSRASRPSDPESTVGEYPWCQLWETCGDFIAGTDEANDYVGGLQSTHEYQAGRRIGEAPPVRCSIKADSLVCFDSQLLGLRSAGVSRWHRSPSLRQPPSDETNHVGCALCHLCTVAATPQLVEWKCETERRSRSVSHPPTFGAPLGCRARSSHRCRESCRRPREQRSS